jgi:hypothetical protein
LLMANVIFWRLRMWLFFWSLIASNLSPRAKYPYCSLFHDIRVQKILHPLSFFIFSPAYFGK